MSARYAYAPRLPVTASSASQPTSPNLRRRRGRSGAVGSAHHPTNERGSFLTILLLRVLRRLRAVAEPLGRGSLYVGLLLVALTSFRLPGGVGSIADPFLFLALLFGVISVLGGQAFNVRIFRIHIIGVALFVAGIMIATLLKSHHTEQSLFNLAKFTFATTGLFWTCVLLLTRRQHIWIALGCWVVSAAVTSFVALLQAFVVGGVPTGYLGRMVGLALDPNDLGTMAAMVIGPSLSLAARRPGLGGTIWLALALIAVGGVVVSASRIGALMALVSIIVWLCLSYRLRRQFTLVTAACCVIGVGAIGYMHSTFGGASIVNRVSDAASLEADTSIQERLYQYQYTLNVTGGQLLVGAGLAKEDAQLWGLDVHNTALLSFRAGGAFAFIGIIIILIDVILKSTKIWWTTKNDNREILSIGLVAGGTALVLSGLTSPILYQRSVWVPAALTFALVAYMRNVRRRHREASASHGDLHDR